jgi:hypothetical protein
VLAEARAYEVDLAIGHLNHTTAMDLIVADRGYASYSFFATLLQQNRDFVIRCSAGSFAVAQEMLQGHGSANRVVVLKAPGKHKKELAAQGIPFEIRVRFVRILLKTGEYEVVASSLLDKSAYTSDDMSEIYRLRWEIEGFYAVLKTRLHLENFSGKSVESVRQDFYSTVYLTGVESILTADSNAELAEREVKHPLQVNKAVSFNAIKNQVFDLFNSKKDVATVVEKLEQLFLMNPVTCRKDRHVPRQKKSDNSLLNYWKRKRKIAY